MSAAAARKQARHPKARIEQTTKELGGAQRQETAYKDQIASMTTEINAVSALAERGNYPRNKLLALQRERTRLEGQLGAVEGDIARNREVIAEAKPQMRWPSSSSPTRPRNSCPRFAPACRTRARSSPWPTTSWRAWTCAPPGRHRAGHQGARARRRQAGEQLAESYRPATSSRMSVRARRSTSTASSGARAREIRFPRFFDPRVPAHPRHGRPRCRRCDARRGHEGALLPRARAGRSAATAGRAGLAAPSCRACPPTC